ncbi:MAG: DUF3793 family protein [Chloroflexales bacterium]|nr:DUF3793 family protein [Chloroflexales bacterium]
MPNHLIHWKTQVDQLPTAVAEFEKWLFVSVASVLFGGKAGELLTLPTYQFGLSTGERLARVALLADLWGVSHRLMHQTAASTKVIIYDEGAVHDVLMRVSLCIFTCELNYAHGRKPAEFLAEVARRWQERDMIPHEIGLSLGYPIKDVLGFMGVLPLHCTGCCGWRIYGDPAASLAMSRAFTAANHRAIRFLHAQA